MQTENCGEFFDFVHFSHYVDSMKQIIRRYTIFLYIFRVEQWGLVDQPQCVSGTIFNGGPRIEVKFAKWSVSLKRLRTAGIETVIEETFSTSEQPKEFQYDVNSHNSIFPANLIHRPA